MRIAVTGGAGFIGSHVTRALVARGDDTHVIDDLSRGRRENVPAGATLHVHDIAEPLDQIFAEIRPAAVLHLAAQIDVRVSVADPVRDARANVIGTIRVLEAARAHGAQVVFSSTGGAIYGECDGPATESAARAPLAPYGVSKLACEEYLAAWNRLHGTRHVSLRLGNVYGPGQDPHGEAGVVAIFFDRIRTGRAATVFGDGSQTRDYVYAGDVAAAMLEAIGASGGTFNIGTGVETSVTELWGACLAASGTSLPAQHERARAGELQRSVLDASLAERDLGWHPRVTLADGLATTWASLTGEE